MRVVGGIVIAFVLLFFVFQSVSRSQTFMPPVYPVPQTRFWDIQSIDTMKDSRDLAREKAHDSAFNQVIEDELDAIAAAGVTHVAIATPYDEEFVSFLTRWVTGARVRGLKVWFRGNWSGWEGWFGYPKISRAQHVSKTKRFIADHADLFSDGDIFDPCQECENGGPGDPRVTGDAAGHAAFLEELFGATKKAFADRGITVTVGVFSMNGDVTSLIMQGDAARRIGTHVTVDHYVETTEKLTTDVARFGKESGLPVLLGEFGSPIPDIHGTQVEDEQAAWLSRALAQLSNEPDLVGLNYWVYRGGSTSLTTAQGTPKQVYYVLSQFYKPESVFGVVVDSRGAPIPNARVISPYRTVRATRSGYFELPHVPTQGATLSVSAAGYLTKVIENPLSNAQVTVTLEPDVNSMWYTVIRGVNGLNAALSRYTVTVE